MADKKGTTLVKQLTNGISAVAAKKEDDFNGADMRAAGIVHAVLGVAIGSVVARSRAQSGKEPIAKLFF